MTQLGRHRLRFPAAGRGDHLNEMSYDLQAPALPGDAAPSRARSVLDGIRSMIQSLRERSFSDEANGDDSTFTYPIWGSAPEPPRFGRQSSQSSSDSTNMATESVEPREDDCPVCLVPMTENCVRTPCGHYFHQQCLEQYFLVAREPGKRARCPLCRGSLHAPMPVEASASSGRGIEVVSVPRPGEMCHLDRAYTFRSIGGFANKPRMLYVITSNEDRKVTARTPGASRDRKHSARARPSPRAATCAATSTTVPPGICDSYSLPHSPLRTP